MKKIRLSGLQQSALIHLSKPGRFLIWGNYPEIVEADGTHVASTYFNTAISFRWRDYIRKDEATGWYALTETGRKELAQYQSETH